MYKIYFSLVSLWTKDKRNKMIIFIGKNAWIWESLWEKEKERKFLDVGANRLQARVQFCWGYGKPAINFLFSIHKYFLVDFIPKIICWGGFNKYVNGNNLLLSIWYEYQWIMFFFFSCLFVFMEIFAELFWVDSFGF